MSTGIFFNGRTTHTPGSYSEVDASGLARAALGATGIVAILGEAEGGSPYNTTDDDDVTVHSITNPGKVAKTFRAGDLLEAGSICFDPSKDPGIPGGAQEIKFVKVNPATQSSYTFVDGAGDDALVVTSKDYGLFATQISVDFSAGTNSGKAIDIAFGSVSESWDDIGGDVIFTAQYNSAATNRATTMTLAVNPASGVSGLFTKTHTGQFDDYDGALGSIAGLDGDKDGNITPTSTVTIVSSDNGDTTQSIIVYGISTATGNPASETIALNGTTPAIGVTTWDEVHAVVKSATTIGTVAVTSTTGAGALFTLSAGANLYTGGGFQPFTESIEVAGGVVSLVADGAATTDCIVVGTSEADAAQLEEVTLNGTTLVPTSGSWNSISGIAVGYVAAARTLTVSGRIFNDGDTVSLVSSSALDTGTAIIYGLDESGDAQTESITLTGTVSVDGTATWSKVLGVDVSAGGAAGAAPAGTITVTASTEAVVVGTFNAATPGISEIDDVNCAGVITTVSSAADDDVILLIGTNAAGAALVEKITVNGTTPVVGASTFATLTGVAILHIAQGSTLTFSGTAFSLSLAGYATVGEVVSYIEALSGWTASEVAGDAGAFLVSLMDIAAAASAVTALSFYAELQRIIDILNDESNIVKAARSASADTEPANTANPVFLVGGVEGTTQFANWQAALDLLRDYRVNTVIVLSDDAAVHAAALAHCVYAAGAGRSERDCILGEESGITLTNAVAAAIALNSRHARLVIQDITRYNTDGVLEQFAPPFTAALAAGMQAGSSVGTSLTFKYANVVDVVGDDATYTIQDDADTLIEAGLCVLAKVPNVGFRWLRNITTYLIDDNLAYTEASVNEAVNYATYTLRTRLESAVGRKGFAGTVNAALSEAVATLGDLMDASVGAITNWRNLTVTLEDDVMTVDVEIAPIIPVNFVKTTLHLVASTISLAA